MRTKEMIVSLCDALELRERLSSRFDGVLIDVREYPEYAAGRIPGSRLIPLGEIERAAPDLRSERPVYVVCRTGRRAAEAGEKLMRMGLAEVRVLEGGLDAWKAAGGDVERDARAPWSLERQVRFTAGSFVLAGVLLSVLASPAFIWLAGFVGAGLIFAAATDTCAMASVLGRMPWNRRRASC